MRYKILFISSWFPNKLQPYDGNFVQRHAEAISDIHDVEILHAVGNLNQKDKFIFEEHTINKIRTLIVYYKNTSIPLINLIRRINAYKKGYEKIQKPDLVHANVMHNNLLFAVWLKFKFKIPFVVSEHWTALRSINHKTTPNIIKRTAKFIGNKADYILPVSTDLSKGLSKIGVQTKMKVIPNVVNTELFTPNHKVDKTTHFLHISSLIDRKNPKKILSAAIKLLKQGHQFKLKIGGGEDENIINELKSQVKNSGFENNIEIFSALPIEMIAEKMKNADYFILFSEDENQPCVIAEAFASGLKVISTNVGGIAEFFPKGFGYLLEKPDEDLLINAMLKALQNPIYDKNKMSDYAEQVFSKNSIAKQFDNVYQEVLKR